MEDKIWRLVTMHCKEKLETPQFTAHNKLCFKNIALPIRYKVHTRQLFCIASLRMTRSQSWCVLKFHKSIMTFVTWTKNSSLVSIALKMPNNMLDWNHARCWKLSKHHENIWLLLYIIWLKIVPALIICMVQWRV